MKETVKETEATPLLKERAELKQAIKKDPNNEDLISFVLLAIDNNIYVETEALLYHRTSLVADIGGTLGLFIEFLS